MKHNYLTLAASRLTRYHAVVTRPQLREQLPEKVLNDSQLASKCACWVHRELWHVGRATSLCGAFDHTLLAPRRRRRLMQSDMFTTPPSSAPPGAYFIGDHPEHGARKGRAQGEQTASGRTLKQPETWRSSKLLSAAHGLPAMSSRPSAPPFGEACAVCKPPASAGQSLSLPKVAPFNHNRLS